MRTEGNVKGKMGMEKDTDEREFVLNLYACSCYNPLRHVHGYANFL